MQAVMLSDTLAPPPPILAQRVSAGIVTPDATGAPDKYFSSLIRSISFHHSTGMDIRFLFSGKRPTPRQLLQQSAFAMLAGCDTSGSFQISRMCAIDMLEDAFTCISNKGAAKLYARVFDELEFEVKMLQFGLMMVLCRLYREVFDADRVKGMRFVIRHAEAARIMVILCPHQFQGHAEITWSDIVKIVHGIQFVTAEVRQMARVQCFFFSGCIR